MFTTILLWIIILLLLIVIWFILDFRYGRKRHMEQATKAKTFPVRYGEAQLIKDGRYFFQELFKDIEQAQDHIHISTFIIKEPGIGTQFLALLERKARDGVQVRLLVDRLGSRLKKTTIHRLKASGILFAYAHKPAFPFIFYSANRRYHRKITVIDGNIAYAGGFNVGNEYVGKKKLGYWRDYHLRIEKEGVTDLQEIFLDDWAEAGGAAPSSLEPSTTEKGAEPLQVFVTEGVGHVDTLMKMIKGAERYALIATPYYVPGKELQNAILDMAERGVHVDILLPKKEDHPLVKDAAYNYFRDLLSAGCNIFEYTPGFFHGKAIIIDGKFVIIGSAKFDKRSFFLNDELDLIFHQEGEMVANAETIVREDLRSAKRITIEHVEKRTWFENGKSRVSAWLSELL
ncbi:cardiolipin synthase [Geomicrobium halophilum]|uniref:Cardiolipin synthase n=1 Tax=Geomicrobium halophilum TaxID=549000 RepID=A0A841PRQ8_9BACL|nr:phospholipase D-like domain-containing protein [Geomicrobium halophilum]MBB6450494.1 cardiolipin synthase [Geomicrobium halophilum]